MSELGGVSSLAFSHDGTRIVAGGEDGALRIVDLEATMVGSPMLGHEDFVRSVAFSPDDSKLASVAFAEPLRLRDAASGDTIAELPTSGVGTLTDGVFEVEIDFEAVAFTPDGTTLLAADGDGAIHRWDVDTLRERATLRKVGSPFAVGPDGRTVAGAWLLDGDVEIRSLDGANAAHTVSSGDGAWDIQISSTGRLATAGTDGTVSTWDISSGAPIASARLLGHTGDVEAIAFTPDGSTLISTTLDESRLWDVARGAELGDPIALASRAIAISPDGRTLAAASGDGLNLYDLGLLTGAGSYELWRKRICSLGSPGTRHEESQFLGGNGFGRRAPRAEVGPHRDDSPPQRLVSVPRRRSSAGRALHS